MSEEPSGRSFQLTDREHRWLFAFLVLATLAAAFLVFSDVAGLLSYFGDVIMIFFLAWLLAFIIGPIAGAIMRLLPRLPSAVAVLLAYGVIFVILVAVIVEIAAALTASMNTLIANWPSASQLREILRPWEDRLASLGFGQVDLQSQGLQILSNIKSGASDLVGPLSGIALSSLGVLGNLLFVVMLSIYMAVDRERILSFLFRLVPPGYAEEAKLLETSVSRSFGGFLRGQFLQGLIYAAVSAFTSAVLGLDFLPVTAAASGVLHAIPFFGPFVSWAPPVLVAIFFKPSAILPAFVLMGIGWFVVMNIIQPRLMADAVGLHPVVVLGSVLVGSKVAGIPGAIFGIPVAAVISAFFFYYLGQRRPEEGSVAVRAARRIEAREGRHVRVPRLPQAGEDADVEDETAPATEPGRAVDRRARARTDA